VRPHNIASPQAVPSAAAISRLIVQAGGKDNGRGQDGWAKASGRNGTREQQSSGANTLRRIWGHLGRPEHAPRASTPFREKVWRVNVLRKGNGRAIAGSAAVLRRRMSTTARMHEGSGGGFGFGFLVRSPRTAHKVAVSDVGSNAREFERHRVAATKSSLLLGTVSSHAARAGSQNVEAARDAASLFRLREACAPLSTRSMPILGWPTLKRATEMVGDLEAKMGAQEIPPRDKWRGRLLSCSWSLSAAKLCAMRR
jgi:hypothetical protein